MSDEKEAALVAVGFEAVRLEQDLLTRALPRNELYCLLGSWSVVNVVFGVLSN